MKVTIMGLGLHGGGLESALFFARSGSRVTVTDLRSENELKPSLESLREYDIVYVLGRHLEENFTNAEIIIKNPGVPKNSPYLELARKNGIPIETDLSVFLSLADNPVIAVTGSKGKSTTASAIHYCLNRIDSRVRIGGNITVSPLSFLKELETGVPVVLELSSWQLSDMEGKGILKPRVSLITNLLPDHMNRYRDMEEYLHDKKLIYQDQDQSDYSLFNRDDPYLRDLHRQSRAKSLFFSSRKQAAGYAGAYLDNGKGYVTDNDKNHLILDTVRLQGDFNRLNLLAAGLALYAYGVKAETISAHLSRFSGIEHRLEHFLTHNGIKYYNDSAATIPQATAGALKSFTEPVYLIAGGTDKNIDFTPLEEVASIPERLYLLAGTATDKIIPLLKRARIPFKGPYDDLTTAVREAMHEATAGSVILLSPGCASFGMFANEFDRGRRFKKTVTELTGSDRSDK